PMMREPGFEHRERRLDRLGPERVEVDSDARPSSAYHDGARQLPGESERQRLHGQIAVERVASERVQRGEVSGSYFFRRLIVPVPEADGGRDVASGGQTARAERIVERRPGHVRPGGTPSEWR